MDCSPNEESIAATAVLLWFTLATPATAIAASRASHVKTHLVPRFYDFHHCVDRPHSLVVKNFTMQLDRMGSEHCDVHFELTSSSNRLTGFRLKIHRCVLGKPSDCEYFNTWAWNMPVCKLMYSDNMVWTPLVHNLDPVFKCPILSGDYFGRNTTLDFEALERMIGGLNLDKYAWPVKVMLDGDQGLFICFDFIAEVRRVKVREHR